MWSRSTFDWRNCSVCNGRRMERLTSGRVSFLLAAALAVCVTVFASDSAYAREVLARDDVHPAESTKNPVGAATRVTVRRSDPLYVLDHTPKDLHGLIEKLRAPPMGSGCANWLDPDLRAGMLVPLPGAAWFLVGDRGDLKRETDTWSIRNLLRKYRLIGNSRSGSPSVGKIVFPVPAAVAEAELECVEHLRGVVVRWLNRRGDPDSGGADSMVVREVRFSRAAVMGSAGRPVPTGDTVVTLSLAEGWIDMVWREMEAQRWGIAGGIVAGVLLTLLSWIVGGTYRKMRMLIPISFLLMNI